MNLTEVTHTDHTLGCTNGHVVTPGCTVLVENLETGNKLPIHISANVGLGEKMIKPGPAAQAVLGHHQGDIVTIVLKGRPVPHKILEISQSKDQS